MRYDGGHKLDRYLVDTLGQYVEWVPVCPEVEMGLPVPRESMRLVGNPDEPQLIAPKSGTDHTEAMVTWAQKRLERLLVKAFMDSFSKKTHLRQVCTASRSTVRSLVVWLSGMAPVCFPARLCSVSPCCRWRKRVGLTIAHLRENFVERIFAYYRWTSNAGTSNQRQVA